MIDVLQIMAARVKRSLSHAVEPLWVIEGFIFGRIQSGFRKSAEYRTLVDLMSLRLYFSFEIYLLERARVCVVIQFFCNFNKFFTYS